MDEGGLRPGAGSYLHFAGGTIRASFCRFQRNIEQQVENDQRKSENSGLQKTGDSIRPRIHGRPPEEIKTG
jgi:hypothetical protein